MAMRLPLTPIRTAHLVGFGIALLVVEAFSFTGRRFVLLALFTVMWLSMIIIDRITRQQGRSLGLRPYIIAVGLGLVVLMSILLFGTHLP